MPHTVIQKLAQSPGHRQPQAYDHAPKGFSHYQNKQGHHSPHSFPFHFFHKAKIAKKPRKITSGAFLKIDGGSINYSNSSAHSFRYGIEHRPRKPFQKPRR